jgi:hypothetical protein
MRSIVGEQSISDCTDQKTGVEVRKNALQTSITTSGSMRKPKKRIAYIEAGKRPEEPEPYQDHQPSEQEQNYSAKQE